jgi:hypothetical protein
MKNRNERHDFEVVGGYDAGLDGDDSRWGRVAVRCGRCDEERRVGIGPAELAVQSGCQRKGRDEPWQPGDLLVTSGGYLDEFVRELPDGRVLTYNAGGHYTESERSDLRPY